MEGLHCTKKERCLEIAKRYKNDRLDDSIKHSELA